MPLYLLEVEWLTDALYSGDREHRIRQELLLGVGGVRALAALGIEPTVFHMNEGHSVFLAARAGEDRWSRAGWTSQTRSSGSGARPSSPPTRLCRPGTRSSARSSSHATSAGSRTRPGSATEELLALGRFGEEDGFGLTPLALRLSSAANGVSDLHGEVAREMWGALGEDDADRPRHERRPPRHLARPGARRAAPRRGRPARGAARRRRTGLRRASSTPTSSGASTRPRRRGSPSRLVSTRSG